MMGVSMKLVSLVTLTFQNSALILIMHYSRIMPQGEGPRYFTSTAVLINEIVKLAVSVSIALYDISHTLPPDTPAQVLLEQLYNSVFSGDGWKLAIPASLYTLQNSLQYIAVSNLDAVHFQILYQLKILTTALFSVTILRRSLGSKKWLALVLLTIGVAIVQIPSGSVDYNSMAPHKSDGFYFPRSFHELGQGAVEIAAELTRRGKRLRSRSASYEGIHEDISAAGMPGMNYSLGVTSVLVAALISGLTGVYFEKVLKDAQSVSVWTRNVQLSFYSLFPALFIGVIFNDGGEISRRGFFAGYNNVVWATIIFQAGGGVLVAMCINYADNIAKNFATSISIIFSCVFSVWFFDFQINTSFFLGTCLVVYSTYLYSSNDRKGSRPSPINIAKYEKTTIDDGTTPKFEINIPLEDRPNFLDPLQPLKAAGFTTSSRPGSPTQRHHSRAPTTRAKRDD